MTHEVDACHGLDDTVLGRHVIHRSAVSLLDDLSSTLSIHLLGVRVQFCIAPLCIAFIIVFFVFGRPISAKVHVLVPADRVRSSSFSSAVRLRESSFLSLLRHQQSFDARSDGGHPPSSTSIAYRLRLAVSRRWLCTLRGGHN